MTTASIKKAAWIYLAALLLMAFSFQADAKEERTTKTTVTTTTTTTTVTPAKDTKKSKDKTKKAKSDTKGSKMTTVVMETSLGNIEIELDGEKAPETTKNFLQYVDDKFYDGVIFHRVIPGFMAQGGGMDEKMNEKKTRAPIKNEATNGLKNKKGTVAMARTNDPHSASAQFFINLVDNDFLDHTSPTPRGWGYAVFGKVTSGMDVVEKMATVPRGSQGMHDDVPKTPIVIKSVRRK